MHLVVQRGGLHVDSAHAVHVALVCAGNALAASAGGVQAASAAPPDALSALHVRVHAAQFAGLLAGDRNRSRHADSRRHQRNVRRRRLGLIRAAHSRTLDAVAGRRRRTALLRRPQHTRRRQCSTTATLVNDALINDA